MVLACQGQLKPFAKAQADQVRTLPAGLKFGKAHAQNVKSEMPASFPHNVVRPGPAGRIARQAKFRENDPIGQSSIPHLVGEPTHISRGDWAVQVFALDQHSERKEPKSNSGTDVPERNIKLSSPW